MTECHTNSIIGHNNLEELPRIHVSACENAVSEANLPEIKVILFKKENKLIVHDKSASSGLIYDIDYLHSRTESPTKLHSELGNRLVQSVMSGICTCCVVIGLQKSGKTNLLFGGNKHIGLIEYTVQSLFSELQKQRSEHQYKVHLKYWEMSRDRVADLLTNIKDVQNDRKEKCLLKNSTCNGNKIRQVKRNDNNAHMEKEKRAKVLHQSINMVYTEEAQVSNAVKKSSIIHEIDGKHSVYRNDLDMLYVSSLNEVEVNNFSDFMNVFKLASDERVRHSRSMGMRWHGFLQLTVETTDTEVGEHCVIRTLTFVHTKGSDRVGAKGIEGNELFEQSQINVSNTLLYAASIHGLEYCNKHMNVGNNNDGNNNRSSFSGCNNSDKKILHDVIIKSQSFFMSCKFTHMMAQFLTGCEASFVVGCVDPLKLDETVDTLEKLQLLRQVVCVCRPIITLSTKGHLLRKLRKLEQTFGGAEVLAMVYSDSTNRPRTEEEEELSKLRQEIDKIDQRVRENASEWAHSLHEKSEGSYTTNGREENDFDEENNKNAINRRNTHNNVLNKSNTSGNSSSGNNSNSKSSSKLLLMKNNSSNSNAEVSCTWENKDKSSNSNSFPPPSTTVINAAHSNNVFSTHGSRKKIYLNASKNATYEGEWCDGVFDGFGEHIQSNFKYRGTFRRGAREGDGALFVRASSSEPYVRIYQGNWRNGQRHGAGTEWCAEGEVYEGEFESDERHGHGKLYCTNGDVIEGEFVHGKCHGYAILHCSNGDWFEGNWEDGVREGSGTWHYVKQQRVLRGEWSLNIPRLGTMEDDDSKVDVSTGKFIPRVFVPEYQKLLAKERDKLNEWRSRHSSCKNSALGSIHTRVEKCCTL